MPSRTAFFEPLDLVDPVLVADVENRADVRMIESSDCSRFALESFAGFWFRPQMRRQNVDRHHASQSRIVRAIHFSHSALTEQRHNCIRP